MSLPTGTSILDLIATGEDIAKLRRAARAEALAEVEALLPKEGEAIPLTWDGVMDLIEGLRRLKYLPAPFDRLTAWKVPPVIPDPSTEEHRPQV